MEAALKKKIAIYASAETKWEKKIVMSFQRHPVCCEGFTTFSKIIQL